jgi:hypothetical protein
MPDEREKPAFPYERFVREASLLEPEDSTKNIGKKGQLLLQCDPNHFAYLNGYDPSSAAYQRAVGGAFKGTYHTGITLRNRRLEARIERELASQETTSGDMSARIETVMQLIEKIRSEEQKIGVGFNSTLILSALAYIRGDKDEKKPK